MRDFYIFDIPFYWCNKEKYYKDMEAAIEKHAYECFEAMGVSRKDHAERYTMIRDRMSNNFGGPWDFNQIVGWLRLYIEGRNVGGHIWMVDATRMGRKMKKVFHLRSTSNALATYLPPGCSSREVFDLTLQYIEEFTKDKYWRRFVFDLEPFKRMGPFVDWNALMESTLE